MIVRRGPNELRDTKKAVEVLEGNDWLIKLETSGIVDGGKSREKLIGDNVIDLRHAFEERAAIMEFDGGMSRADAERAAAEETGFNPMGSQ